MEILNYKFEVVSRDGEFVFHTEKPTLELLEEEIGRFERHLKETFEE